MSEYLEIIKNINKNELSSKDYNKEVKKLIKVVDYLNKKSKNYFTKDSLHSCFKITFKINVINVILNMEKNQKN